MEILALLRKEKPLAASSFSADQMIEIVKRWHVFTSTSAFHKNSRKPDKVHTAEPAFVTYERIQPEFLPGTEYDWVMHTPPTTAFGHFLLQDSELMRNLQLSFRPILSHLKMLEPSDMAAIMLRYVHWLNFGLVDQQQLVSIRILGSMCAADVPTTIQKISGDFSASAINIFLFFTKSRDAKNCGTWNVVLIDMHAHTFEYYGSTTSDTTSVAGKFVHGLFRDVLTWEDDMMLMDSLESLKSIDGMCGLDVVLFVHARLVEQKNFEEARNVPRLTCSHAQRLFFSGIPAETPESRGINMIAIPFGNFDVRLATVSIARLVLSDRRSSTSRKEILLWGRQKKMKYQKIVEQIETLPNHREFWPLVLSEIQQDPLTVHLRAKVDGRFMSSARRGRTFAAIYLEITGTHQGNRALHKFVRQLLSEVYIPALQGASQSKTIFIAMTADEFLSASAKTLGSVSFGSHFLREVDKWVTTNTRQARNETLTQQYFHSSRLVRRMSAETADTLSKTITKCNRLMDNAENLLKSVYSVPDSVANIILRNTEDLVQHRFLLDGPHPWNFPADLTCLEVHKLMESMAFKVNYAIGIKVLVHAIQIIDSSDSDFPQVSQGCRQAIDSLKFFTTALEAGSLDHRIFCRLARDLRKVSKSPSLLCTFESGDELDRFFSQVEHRYRDIFYQKM